MKTSNIGLIGLAVMGENLALNMESKGFAVSVYNRTAPGEEGVVDRFMSGRGKGKNFIGTHTIQEFVESIERPRKIMLMVKAGAPVDELMAQLIPYLSPGDVIIDGGNSDFHDTERRVKEMEAHGMYFVGTGISGGEIGALYGPSVMPGGSPAAWPLVKDVWAVGAGAVTKLLSPDRKEGKRIDTVKNVDQYIERIDEMIERKRKYFQSMGC